MAGRDSRLAGGGDSFHGVLAARDYTVHDYVLVDGFSSEREMAPLAMLPRQASLRSRAVPRRLFRQRSR